jgi:hypothetical protein
LSKPGDYALLAREYCKIAYQQGVRYMEITATPIARDYDALGDAIDAANESPVTVNWILDVPRFSPVEVGWQILDSSFAPLDLKNEILAQIDAWQNL